MQRILTFLPEQVKMEKAVAEYPPEQSEGSLLSLEG
ncbi:creatininase [Tolypothrix sp. NIES-4075]|nr:creatininase [Tolypothrix sp. NIES-4075]